MAVTLRGESIWAAAATVDDDGERWMLCPYGGWKCCRISLTQMGEVWAGDALDVHLRLHHAGWR